MITKAKFNVTVDAENLKEAKRILKELGITFSFYIDTILKALVRSETDTMKEVYGEVYGPLFEKINNHARAMKKIKKK